MKNAWWAVLLMGLTLPFLSGCLSSSDDNSSTVILTAEDNGRTITLPKDGLLEVILKGNPTTGYYWQTVSINPAVLQYQQVEFNPDSAEIGAGGTYVFTYRAAAAGTTPLQLNNASSTNGANAAQTFQVTVTVTSA